MPPCRRILGERLHYCPASSRWAAQFPTISMFAAHVSAGAVLHGAVSLLLLAMPPLLPPSRQGLMEVTGVRCARCRGTIGWKFCADLGPFLNVWQVGGGFVGLWQGVLGGGRRWIGALAGTEPVPQHSLSLLPQHSLSLLPAQFLDSCSACTQLFFPLSSPHLWALVELCVLLPLCYGCNAAAAVPAGAQVGRFGVVTSAFVSGEQLARTGGASHRLRCVSLHDLAGGGGSGSSGGSDSSDDDSAGGDDGEGGGGGGDSGGSGTSDSDQGGGGGAG